uniref:Calmodulin-binding protein 60-C n=1 Tax=Rhizophora mucronata TaxID=61149 RepID=A0A2P2M0F0_RHIMU
MRQKRLFNASFNSLTEPQILRAKHQKQEVCCFGLLTNCRPPSSLAAE